MNQNTSSLVIDELFRLPQPIDCTRNITKLII